MNTDNLNFKDSEKLLSAFRKGPVRAIGGIVFDAEHKALMSTTDMYHAVRELGRRGLDIQRTDAGGSPTWSFFPKTNLHEAL